MHRHLWTEYHHHRRGHTYRCAICGKLWGWKEKMDVKEAKDILSDMRDQHLCFLESSESKDEWQKNYLKEAWACDFGAKSLEKQIPRKPIDKTKPDDTASLAYENCNIVVCPTCGGRLKLKSKGKYCDKCGQKLDWGGSEKSCQTNLHQK